LTGARVVLGVPAVAPFFSFLLIGLPLVWWLGSGPCAPFV
jgi:hypothetical protein